MFAINSLMLADTPVAGPGMTNILKGVTTLLTWILQSMTSVCTWVLSNNLAFIYVGLFLAGAALGFLFRVLRSV